MKCCEVKGQLSPYLDGALDKAVRGEIMNHLEACHDCLKDFSALGTAVNVLHSLPPATPPPEFCETVLKKVSINRSKKKNAVRPLFRTVAMAAALFLVVGVTALFYGSPLQWVTKTLSQKSLLKGITAATDDGAQPGSIPDAADSRNGFSGAGLGNDPEKSLVRGGGPADLSTGETGTAVPVTAAPITGVAGRTGGGTGEIQIAAQQGTRLNRAEPVNGGMVLLAGLPPGSQKIASREYPVSRQVSFGSLQASQLERQKVILGATLAVDADPAGFTGEAAAIARSNGGSVLSGGEGEGFPAMRVPAGHFEQALNSLRRLDQVSLISVSRDDMTQQYLDIESRIRNLSAEEQRLILSYNVAATEEEKAAAGAKLSAVRQGLGQEKKAFDELAGKVDYATINIIYGK